MKNILVTLRPYATQKGRISVPNNIKDDEIETYIKTHFDYIKIEGETEFGYNRNDIDWEFEEEPKNVEPIFHVGDCVVGANNVYEIISLNDGLKCYIAVTANNEKVKIPYYFDNGKGYMCSYRLVTNIMDTYNSHDAELVCKINTAWKSVKYHERFQHILFALACRDSDELYEKFEIKISDIGYAMTYAHEIMEGVCDDLDLETILSFIRFEE